MTAQRVCPHSHCAELNDADAVYCHACHCALIENPRAARCYYCGRKIAPGSRVCREHWPLLRLDPNAPEKVA